MFSICASRLLKADGEDFILSKFLTIHSPAWLCYQIQLSRVLAGRTQQQNQKNPPTVQTLCLGAIVPNPNHYFHLLPFEKKDLKLL